MNKSWLAVSILFAGLVGCQQPMDGSIAFTHVTVINATDTLPQPDMTLVVADGRIASLEKSGANAVPAPGYLSATWGANNVLTAKYVPEDYVNDSRVFEKLLQLVRTMHRAGVKFMPGTDTSDPYIFPGFSVHDELALFVRAGMTPLEALRTATWNPAEYLGITDSAGSVAVGKVADLVFLDANPIEEIRNTQRIWAVVVRGKVLEGLLSLRKETAKAGGA
jgi:imidazolonepropionase-like amidohydrolase